MTNQRLHQLLHRYLSGQASPAEETALYQIINEGNSDEELKELLSENWESVVPGIAPDDEKAANLLRFILDQRPSARLVPWYRKPMVRRIAVAAVIVSLLFVALFYKFSVPAGTDQMADNGRTGKNQSADIAPGRSGAVLRLADGRSIILDTVRDGLVSMEGNTQARKEGTQISYENGGQPTGADLYNTIETPRGRQFSLILHDGTKVWLNAMSSIRFPVQFSGTNRPVDITGEVYFEVAKDKAKPFIVQSGGMQIQVLGTHFNVKAYGDEQAIRTTLVEGLVKVSKNNVSEYLKPGQQAEVFGSGQLRILAHADIEEALAWKNGRIAFTNAGIEDIMRQVSKWYDVEVVYRGSITKRTFTADISRNTNLSEFLKVLELSNIHFDIDGRTLIVKP